LPPPPLKVLSVVAGSVGGEVEFLLDSGVNEHMLCSRENLKTLSSRKSKIFTATGSGENALGVFGEHCRFSKRFLTILEGKVIFKGRVVHQQVQTPQSGLFPLTLYQDPREG